MPKLRKNNLKTGAAGRVKFLKPTSLNQYAARIKKKAASKPKRTAAPKKRPAQFRNRNLIEFWRLQAGATFDSPIAARVKLGEAYFERRDMTGHEIAANASVPQFAETIMLYGPPTIDANGKIIGVPYRRGDYARDMFKDEVFKITAIRDTSTQQRRVEITGTRTSTSG